MKNSTFPHVNLAGNMGPVAKMTAADGRCCCTQKHKVHISTCIKDKNPAGKQLQCSHFQTSRDRTASAALLQAANNTLRSLSAASEHFFGTSVTSPDTDVLWNGALEQPKQVHIGKETYQYTAQHTM
jgi:hypothetical protein